MLCSRHISVKNKAQKFKWNFLAFCYFIIWPFHAREKIRAMSNYLCSLNQILVPGMYLHTEISSNILALWWVNLSGFAWHHVKHITYSLLDNAPNYIVRCVIQKRICNMVDMVSSKTKWDDPLYTISSNYSP